MVLTELVRGQQAAVAEAWYQMMLETYPAETAKLWKANKDKFTNPVGARYEDGLNELTGLILDWQDADAICTCLDGIIRIRAIQEFAPSKGLAFIFFFKKILRKLFGKEIRKQNLVDELAQLDSRVDNLALLAFDVYAKSREELFRMRVNEFKRTHHMLFRKAGIVCELPEEDGPGTAAAIGDLRKEPSE